MHSQTRAANSCAFLAACWCSPERFAYAAQYHYGTLHTASECSSHAHTSTQPYTIHICYYNTIGGRPPNTFFTHTHALPAAALWVSCGAPCHKAHGTAQLTVLFEVLFTRTPNVIILTSAIHDRKKSAMTERSGPQCAHSFGGLLLPAARWTSSGGHLASSTCVFRPIGTSPAVLDARMNKRSRARACSG